MKSIVRRLIVGYARSATTDNSSIKRQEKQIKKYCQKNYCYKLDEMFIDNGYSGVSLKRPSLKKLLTKTKKGDICRIVCLDRSRLSRSLADFSKLMRLFEKHEVDVVFTTETNIPTDFFEETIANVNAFEARVHLNHQKRKKLGK